MISEVSKQLTNFSGLVDCIYQAALDPYTWNKTLPAMAGWMDAPMAMLFTPTVLPQNGGFHFKHGITEAAMELWATHYQPLDIWTTTAIQRDYIQEGLTFTGEDLVPKKELKKSVWYQDFISRIGIGQVLVNIIFGLDSKIHQPTALSFFRDLNEIEFGVEDRWKASLLLPHISRAIGVAAQLRNTAYRLATSLTAIDRLPHGILLIGEKESVLFSNQAALRILHLEDGLRLQKTKGSAQRYLVAQHSCTQESLQKAIRAAIDPDILSTPHFSKIVAVQRPSGHAPFTLSFSSLPTQHGFAIDGHDIPRAIVFIVENDAPIKINHALLKDTYGLTKAEIRTSELVVVGKSLEEISAECGLSANTLKTHLNHIYGKTNTANRAMLVKLLVTLSGHT